MMRGRRFGGEEEGKREEDQTEGGVYRNFKSLA